MDFSHENSCCDASQCFHRTCSGSLSCSRPLCLRVVCRIFTSSTGLQDDRRGISSKSLSTKLSWRCGSSVRNSLREARNTDSESGQSVRADKTHQTLSFASITHRPSTDYMKLLLIWTEPSSTPTV